MKNQFKAAVFYYLIRPVMNRLPAKDSIADCPMCGELLFYYENDGFLHLADGDAD